MFGWFVRPAGSPSVREDPLRSLGRVVLWTCAALVFVRGLFGVLQSPRVDSGPAPAALNARAFPDEEARAFVVAFARRYLTVTPGHESTYAHGIERFLAEGLADQATVIVSSESLGVTVAQAVVAREIALDSSHALVTVAASMTDRRTLYLTVPVARDERGGLAVYDLPSFGPPPPAARILAQASTPLAGKEADAIGDLTGRFLRAYIGGEREEGLAYFLAPGTRVVPMPAGFRLLAVDEIAGEPGAGRRRVVRASVRVRESGSRAVYALRYEITLLRGERWHVAAVAGGPSA